MESKGIIIRGRGGLYTAMDDAGNEYVLRAKKKFRRMGISPLVGDRILFVPGEISDEHGWVEEILPRTSQCLRPPVANVTLLCIVVSPSPAPDWLLVDKLMIFAARQQLKPILIVNKADLDEDEKILDEARRMYARANMDVYSVSARTGKGKEKLLERFQGQVCCFSGQSGVGKSTLLNQLFGLQVETGDISQKIQRGKNTTRHAEMFRFGTVSVIDTPGFSLLELDAVFDPVLLQDYYPEFEEYRGRCRFSPCYHAAEPGCCVRDDESEGKIDHQRMERYRQILKDCREAWRERYD